MDTLWLLLADLLRQTDGFILGAHITREDVDTSRSLTINLLSLLKNFGSTTSDVNLGSIGYQGLSNHQANARGTGCNDSSDMRNVGQGTSREVVIIRLVYNQLGNDSFKTLFYLRTAAILTVAIC